MESFTNQLFGTPEQREALIVPIERMCLPAALDGSIFWEKPHGMFGTQGIKNDIEAIQLWVCQYSGKSMRHECLLAIEKLLLWCVVERGHSLAEFSPEELPLVCNFFTLVEPRHRWMDHLYQYRRQPHWRPFRTVVPAQAVGKILTLCNAYFKWAEVSGLDMPHRPWSDITRLIRDKKSVYYRPGKTFSVPLITLDNWIALRQFFPEKGDDFIDLQALVTLELLFYGGITITHALTLKTHDFKAHKKSDGTLGSWEFPAGNNRDYTVFSVGPLTASISQLLQDTQNHAHDLLDDKCIFSIREFRVRKTLANAKKAASVHLRELGLKNDSESIAKLTLARLRGGLMADMKKRNTNFGLFLIFSWLYVRGFPSQRGYCDQEILKDEQLRLKNALKLNEWIEKCELDSVHRMLQLQCVVCEGCKKN